MRAWRGTEQERMGAEGKPEGKAGLDESSRQKSKVGEIMLKQFRTAASERRLRGKGTTNAD